MTSGLEIERREASTSPSLGRLVLLHGFTQTRRSWDQIADAFGDRYETIAVDAPGHGGSAGVRLDLAGAAEAVAQAAGPATYVGYSMGGRLALHVAVARPDVVERLVLVSASPGIADPAVRAERRADDEHLADEIERDGVDAFLERWLALPLFARLPTDSAGLEERRANTAVGLASSLRLAGTGAQRPLWDRLDQLTMPVLLVVGEHDAKFRATAAEMATAIAGATVEIIAGAGHVVHLEQPAAFVALLRGWLASGGAAESHAPRSTR
jgi:2-succinyl-6-hydroxy-2,4-cyclohexadiene-1-carboxylate synthase